MSVKFLTEDELQEFEQRNSWAYQCPDLMANWTLRLIAEIRQRRAKDPKVYECPNCSTTVDRLFNVDFGHVHAVVCTVCIEPWKRKVGAL